MKNEKRIPQHPLKGEKDVQKQSTEFKEQVPFKHPHGAPSEDDKQTPLEHPHQTTTPVALKPDQLNIP
jgi:hypothetical protein